MKSWQARVLHESPSVRRRGLCSTVYASQARLPGIPCRRQGPTKLRVRPDAKPNTNNVLKRLAMTMSEENQVPRRFLDCAVAFLVGDYLPKIERCLEKLTEEQIWWRPNEESNSIG